MPLSKANGNMYDWCTHTHTHLGGACPHECSYCYVQAMGLRFGNARYQGPPHLIEKELSVKYGTNRTIFVEHCTDLWADAMPGEWIGKVLEHCCKWPCNDYVFQSKNPERFHNWVDELPPRRLLGTTIESADESVCASVSTAPPPARRIAAIRSLKESGERVFVTVEPILYGYTKRLAEWLVELKPEFVNIGADSKGRGLIEPSGNEVRALLDELKSGGVQVRQKTNLERLLR